MMENKLRAFLRVCVYICIAGALALAGCSASKSSMTTQSQTEQSRNEALRAIESQSDEITSMRATGTAAIESSSLNETVSIDVSLRAPDSIRIKVSGPFGITLGEIFATRTNYIYYNAWENTLQSGALLPNQYLPLPGFTLSFDDAFAFLKGKPPALKELQRGGVPDSTLKVIVCTDINGRTVECLLSDSCVQRARITQTDGKKITEYFSGFADIDAGKFTVPFPKRLSVSAEQQGKMTIRYDDVNINTPDVDFSIPAPSSAKVVGAH